MRGNPLKSYKRVCSVCSEIYDTTAKRGKFCPICLRKRELSAIDKRLEVIKYKKEYNIPLNELGHNISYDEIMKLKKMEDEVIRLTGGRKWNITS